MRRLSIAFLLAWLGASWLPAAEVPFAARLEQLEAETLSLRAEVQTLRAEAAHRTPAQQAVPASWSGGAPEETDYYTVEQVQQMVDASAKKNAWRKGDFTITPYGFLWGNMVYETERSNVGSYALFIRSPEASDDDNFVVDGRNTRLGVDVVGPRLWFFDCVQSGGKVEFDFQGSFVTENKAGVLLRHAYCEVKNDDFRLLMGQTWDVISPLYPGTIMYSVYWGAGNIGYRRAQLRGERYLHFSPVSMITLQGSLNLSVVSDFTGTTDGIEGDHGGWPVIEGRAAWTLGQRGKGCMPIEIGASGHIGNQAFHADVAALPDYFVRPTWSINADFRVPITHRLGVQGEFFTGENLGTFLGGVLQGVDSVTAVPIRSTGGWVELWFDWTPRWHTHSGFTIDDPLNSTVTSASGRIYNSAYYANLVYDVTKQFQMGVEVSSWKTLFKDQRPGESVRIEFMAKYGF